MSQNEKEILIKIQRRLSPSISIYTDVILNQSKELGFDIKKFWIDNALIRTYDYIRMSRHKPYK